MMTIKHIDLSGEEFVYPTTRVNFIPAAAKSHTSATNSLWRYDEDGRAHEIDSGHVYVMNVQGKTVARYTLSDNGPEVQGIPARVLPPAGTAPNALTIA